jgi:hypothetical protein
MISHKPHVNAAGRVCEPRRLSPNSPSGGSPTLYYDEDDDTYVIQGWKITDSAVLAQITIPDHETVIRFPRRMMQFFPEVNGDDV